MNKLLLLISIFVLFIPSLVNGGNLEEQLAEYEKKYCQNNVEDKIAILHPDGYFECTSEHPKEKPLNKNNTPVNFLDTEGRIYCLRNNGTVYDIADSQSCEPNKEISLDKFIAIKGQKNHTETNYEKKLTKLKSLFENELITKEEYDKKRKDILDEM